MANGRHKTNSLYCLLKQITRTLKLEQVWAWSNCLRFHSILQWVFPKSIIECCDLQGLKPSSSQKCLHFFFLHTYTAILISQTLAAVIFTDAGNLSISQILTFFKENQFPDLYRRVLSSFECSWRGYKIPVLLCYCLVGKPWPELLPGCVRPEPLHHRARPERSVLQIRSPGQRHHCLWPAVSPLTRLRLRLLRERRGLQGGVWLWSVF